MAPSVVRSVCPFDCPDACGLRVEVADGRAVRVTGDPDHPVTRGLLCPKMANYERTVHSPLRLTTPLLRTGPKGSGSFRPIPWDEAVSRICARFRELSESHGGESILPYSYAGTMGLVQRNAGHAFFHRLGASRLERTICSPAKDAGARAVVGDTPAMDPDEVADADLVVLWGINAAATSIHAMRDASAARRRGARLWAVDGYLTPTCRAADEAFLVRPGTDAALAMGMMHVLVSERLHDEAYLAEEALGFGEFAARVLPDCAPGPMSGICGVPADTIVRMAREYAAARAPFIRLGSGLSRYGNGAMTVRTLHVLPALVGAWRRRGGGLFGGTSTGAAFPLHEIEREDFLPGPVRWISMNRLGEALTELRDPPVLALYVYHSNPAAIAPDQNAVLRGLSREELFTVVHERFLTDTARYADLVLPATSSLEHPDLYRAYGHYHAQRCDAAIPPVGESRSNWDAFRALAEGMGWDEPFFRQDAAALVDLLLSGESPWRDAEADRRLRAGLPARLVPPFPSKGSWRTPSGRIEIRNDREAEPLPVLLPTHAEGDGYPLRLLPATTPFALNSSFYEREDLRARQPLMTLAMHPDDAGARGLLEGDGAVAFNDRGEVRFTVTLSERIPRGTAVTEGVWWSSQAPGGRGVNALTSQRLTDGGRGSTLYDVAVEVRRDG